MGDANYDEDDIPEGETKDNYMFAQDKKREELLFSSGALAGIDFSNYEKFKVEVEGKSIPNPLDTFQSVRWSPVIENAINLYGWRVPTPVQKYALPAAINHYDVIASAQTGSGKTARYLMPSIRYLLQTPFEKNSTIGYKMMSLPRVLIVAPVRELAQQINKEALKLSYRSSLKSVCVFGGSGYRDQLEGLKKGCDILVATPGRLKDMVEKQHIGLGQVRFLILDEADRMLDMGFKDDIANIINMCPPPKTGPDDKDGRQTLMFSATFPKDIQIFAMEYLREDHVFIQVGRVGSTTELITQTMEYVEDFEKSARLVELLDTVPGKTLVFCQTKHDCDRLEREIRRRGIRCMAFHGGKTQQSREIALSKFGSGQLRVIFATDVASRGLDVADVKHVVIYDLPTHVDDYVHRIGRTGRAGNKGLATSMYNSKNQNIAKELKDILTECNQVVPQFIEDDSHNSSGSTYRTGSRAKSESSFVNSFAQRSGGDRSGGGGYGDRSTCGGYGNRSGGGGGYGDRSAGGGGGAPQRGGDWECGKCGANNFARNNNCFKRECGAARPNSPSGGGYGDRSAGGGGGYGDRQPAGGSSWGDAGGAYGDRQPAGGSSWGEGDRAGGGGSYGGGGGNIGGGDSWGTTVQPSPSNDQWGNNTAISQAGGSAGWD
jgi:ATP-dependent RNA helicase DDX3X